MAYQLLATFTVAWVGDGAGQMSVPGAQVLTQVMNQSTNGVIQIPGGDAPSTANITTACNSMATAAAAKLNANIAQIQGFASGNP